MGISNIVKNNSAVVRYTVVSDFEDVADESVVYESDSPSFITINRNHKMANIVYNNDLNLPDKIEFDSGHTMENNYDANGNLVCTLQRNIGIIMSMTAVWPGIGNITVFNPFDTEQYSGAWQFENGTLDRIHIPGGYIKDNNVYFYIPDHQGNIRQVWNATTNLTVQDNHYYPYGSLFGESASTEYLNVMSLLSNSSTQILTAIAKLGMKKFCGMREIL